jgi:hypothetical protein
MGCGEWHGSKPASRDLIGRDRDNFLVQDDLLLILGPLDPDQVGTLAALDLCLFDLRPKKLES